MTAPRRIEVTVAGGLFARLDPSGLRREASARRYLQALRARLSATFPDAELDLTFEPAGRGAFQVRTEPPGAATRRDVLRVARGLREQLTWIVYDASERQLHE